MKTDIDRLAKENEELARLVQAVRDLKEEKKEALKGFRDAIQEAEGAVERKAVEILSGQKSILDAIADVTAAAGDGGSVSITFAAPETRSGEQPQEGIAFARSATSGFDAELNDRSTDDDPDLR